MARNGNGIVYDIPDGTVGKAIGGAEQVFLKSVEKMPSKIFDVKRDFGAKGDGKSDDTEAVRKTIAAAREHGKDALAYFPRGVYAVKETIAVTGANYRIGGSGFGSAIIWKGPTGGAMIAVHDPDHITMEDIVTGRHDYPCGGNEADILQTSSGKPSFMRYDRVWVFGQYQKQPLVRGFRAVNLGRNDVVHMNEFNGNLRFTDSADATVYLGTTYEGTMVVEGASTARGGFLGVSVRLSTLSDPALWIKDNHSITMSDFYTEQGAQFIRLEGDAKLPAGQVVMSGAKFEIRETQERYAVEINDYRGALLLGPYQYYVGNPRHRFVQKGDSPFTLNIMGSCFYRSRTDLTLHKDAAVSALGNSTTGQDGEGTQADAEEARGVADLAIDDAKARAALAFDAFRQLGRIEMRLAFGAP